MTKEKHNCRKYPKSYPISLNQLLLHSLNFKCKYNLMRIRRNLLRRKINHRVKVRLFLRLIIRVNSHHRRRFRQAFALTLMRLQVISPPELPRTFVTSEQLIVRYVRLQMHFQIEGLVEDFETDLALVRLLERSRQLGFRRFRIDDDLSGCLRRLLPSAMFFIAMRFQVIASFELLRTDIAF